MLSKSFVTYLTTKENSNAKEKEKKVSQSLVNPFVYVLLKTNNAKNV